MSAYLHRYLEPLLRLNLPQLGLAYLHVEHARPRSKRYDFLRAFQKWREDSLAANEVGSGTLRIGIRLDGSNRRALTVMDPSSPPPWGLDDLEWP
jgi:hypothetical protein